MEQLDLEDEVEKAKKMISKAPHCGGPKMELTKLAKLEFHSVSLKVLPEAGPNAFRPRVDGHRSALARPEERPDDVLKPACAPQDGPSRPPQELK